MPCLGVTRVAITAAEYNGDLSEGVDSGRVDRYCAESGRAPDSRRVGSELAPRRTHTLALDDLVERHGSGLSPSRTSMRNFTAGSAPAHASIRPGARSAESLSARNPT